MNKVLIVVATIFFAHTAVSAQAEFKNIAAAYQWCPFPCETYKINSDFTFDYLIDGDLFNNERTKGTWAFVGKNKIHLKSGERKLIRKVSEEVGNNNDRIKITVQDNAGGLFPGIIVRTQDNGIERQYITDENGNCEIPRSYTVEVAYLSLTEKYTIQNRLATHLKIEIDPLDEPFVDDIFVIRKNILCKMDGDKEFPNCYSKLSKKIEKKTFSG